MWLKFFIFLLLCAVPIIILINVFKVKSHAPSLTIRDHKFTLSLALTLIDQEKGLGDRDSILQNAGMLFLFNKPSYLRFWMKDMRFPLDIIYIQGDKIVTIYKNVPNPAKPSETLKIYTSEKPADKVLEINGGLSDKYHFSNGDTVNFSL